MSRNLSGMAVIQLSDWRINSSILFSQKQTPDDCQADRYFFSQVESSPSQGASFLLLYTNNYSLASILQLAPLSLQVLTCIIRALSSKYLCLDFLHPDACPWIYSVFFFIRVRDTIEYDHAKVNKQVYKIDSCCGTFLATIEKRGCLQETKVGKCLTQPSRPNLAWEFLSARS